MKRTVCLILAVVMLVPVVAFAAEDFGVGKAIQESCKTVLKQLCDMYHEDPALMDMDRIFWLYSYYELYMSAKRVARAEMEINIRQYAPNVIFSDTDKTLELGNAKLNSALEAQYTQWLNGEKSNIQFADYLVRQTEAALKQY